MSIISQESFEKLTKEEKEEIREIYKLMKEEPSLVYANEYAEKLEWLEDYFGKENLQHKPIVKTWKDCQEMNENSNFFIRLDNNLELSGRIYSKCTATLKIAKIIELGYGGLLTNKETEEILPLWIVQCDYEGKVFVEKYTGVVVDKMLAFRTQELAEEFISYPENVELIRQYCMI